MKTKRIELKNLIKECIEEVLFENMSRDTSREEMLQHLSSTPYSHEDGFTDDAEVAMYWYSHDHHGGQSTNLYSVLSTSPYSPGSMRRSVEGEGSGAEMMYDELVHEFGGTPLGQNNEEEPEV